MSGLLVDNSSYALELLSAAMNANIQCSHSHSGFSFNKFLDSKKKKNPKLDDAAATEAAENRFLGTMWLMNSKVPHSVTDNLVQAHISGHDNYPESVEKAFTMVSVIKEASSDSRTAVSLAQANEASSGQSSGGQYSGRQGGRGGPDNVRGTVVADKERNQQNKPMP